MRPMHKLSSLQMLEHVLEDTLITHHKYKEHIKRLAEENEMLRASNEGLRGDFVALEQQVMGRKRSFVPERLHKGTQVRKVPFGH